MIGIRWQPPISPNVDQGTISHPPATSLFNEFSPMSNASPSIRRMTRHNGFKEGIIGKILGFVNLIQQRILIVKEPPALFS